MPPWVALTVTLVAGAVIGFLTGRRRCAEALARWAPSAPSRTSLHLSNEEDP